MAIAAAVLLAAVPLGAGGASPGDELVACRSKVDGQKRVTVRSDRWVRIGVPKFDAGEGPATLTALAAAPNRANMLTATNGQVVKLSVDAGCTWETIYRGNSVDADIPGYTPDVVRTLVAPSDTSLWLASYDDVASAPHPHVYVGSEIGVDGKPAHFGQLDVGLPAYGKPVALTVSGLPGGEAYLLLDELPDPKNGNATAPTRRLYTTYVPDNPPELGGVTGLAWKQVVPPAGLGPIEGVARQDGRSIWLWSGKTFAFGTRVDSADAVWHIGSARGRVLDVEVDSSGLPVVVEQTQQGVDLAVADTQGRLGAGMGVPVTPSTFTHGERQNVWVASGADGTWGFDHRLHRWVDITPQDVPAFTSLGMGGGTTGRIVLGLRPDAIYRWDTYRDETFVEPPPPPKGVGDPHHPVIPTSDLEHAVLSPTKQVVTVAPGVVRDVPVTFRVPPAPTPLDVYFLVDTTYSMGPAIRGLRKAIKTIAGDIRSKLGVSACFGVGDVKDLSADSPYIFKTLLPVSPCDVGPGLPKVNSALSKLSEIGGGDTPEAQTIALTQAVTGAGQTYLPIPAGEGAGFRHGAFKVIVLISDAPSHQGSGYPTIQEAVTSLNVDDVKVVSIAVNDGGADLAGAKAMMNAIAVGTESMSPPAGVDCNGDGGGYYGDLGPGEPLVCEISVTSAGDGSGRIVNIGPAILGLLLAVKDPGTIAVDVNDPFGVVRGPIRGLTSQVLDLKYETGLHFTLPVGCDKAQAGKDWPVELVPTVRSLPVGLMGEVLVSCRTRPAAHVVLPPPLIPPAPLNPPVRPLVGLAAPAPPPPANAPGQPISNTNPNPGAAHEEQEQPQLATAGQEVEEAETDELAMSSRRASPVPYEGGPLPLALGAAFLTALACGYRLRTRADTGLQLARND